MAIRKNRNPLFHAPNKVGRPPLICNDNLKSRFTAFLGFFEYHWSDVGWDLSQAKTLESIRNALRRVRRESPSELQPFIFEPTNRTDLHELKELRLQERKVAALCRLAFEGEVSAREKLETASHAVRAYPEDTRLQQLKARCDQRYMSSQKQLSALREEDEQLNAKIKQKEAYLSQSGLLDFVRSSRYTLSPISFAKAMAGLPFITWRQSAIRLAKAEIRHPHALEYEKFRIVQDGLSLLPVTSETAIASLKSMLLRKKGSQFAHTTLKNEWYFLKAAIEKAYENRPARRAIPFRVYSEYQQRTASRSAADILLQEDEAL